MLNPPYDYDWIPASAGMTEEGARDFVPAEGLGVSPNFYVYPPRMGAGGVEEKSMSSLSLSY